MTFFTLVSRLRVPGFAVIALLTGMLLGCGAGGSEQGSDVTSAGVRAHPDHPHYLSWGDTPIYPLGATGYHSWTPISRPGTMDFRVQMDRLAASIDSVGSPHVRGFVRALPYDPMNHLHDGKVDRVLQPWVRTEDGRYDLRRFEPEWEKRLRAFLETAREREIVVALELWDDWSVTRGPGGEYDPGSDAAWSAHPFHPENNVNYDASVLPDTTAACGAPFYDTVREQGDAHPALDLQKRYVDRVLEIASGFPNVIVNVSNESRADLRWSRFWIRYARKRLPEEVMVGEMPSVARDSDRGQCDPELGPRTLIADSLYDFVDVAQAVSGHAFDGARRQAIGGGARMASYRRTMRRRETSKPLLVSKDYTRGAEGGDLILWGRFAGGAAAFRFHRLGHQHGPEVRRFQHRAIERLGRFLAEIPFWRLHPARGLLTGLSDGAGANVLADLERPGDEDARLEDGHLVAQLVGVEEGGGSIAIRTAPGAWSARWVDPGSGATVERRSLSGDSASLTLEVPGGFSHLVLHLRPAGEPAGEGEGGS